MTYIREVRTLASMRRENQIYPSKIYYGANTCWWTDDPRHLCRHPESGLPCDPRGGMLFETTDVEGFLARAEANPDFYGRHGLRAFMAAHHLNCVVSKEDARSTCFRIWDEYNDILDAQGLP